MMLRALTFSGFVLLTAGLVSSHEEKSAESEGERPIKIEVTGTLRPPVDGSTFFLELKPKPKLYRMLASIQVACGGNKELLKRAEKLVGKTVTVSGSVVETAPSRGFPKDWDLILVVEPTDIKEAAPAGAPAGREAKAVKAIEELKGKVKRDAKREGAPVVAVYFVTARLGEKALKLLPELEHLEYVHFFNATIEGDALKYLKDVKNLRILGLSFTRVPAKNGFELLKELSVLKKLEYIEFGYTEIAGARDPRREILEALPGVKFIGGNEGERIMEKAEK